MLAASDRPGLRAVILRIKGLCKREELTSLRWRAVRRSVRLSGSGIGAGACPYLLVRCQACRDGLPNNDAGSRTFVAAVDLDLHGRVHEAMANGDSCEP